MEPPKVSKDTSFNQSGNGAAGDLTGSGNCSGDNCRISGFDGGDSYAGNIAGGSGGSSSGSGTAGSAGTRGSGGGGGAAQIDGGGATNGAVGGNGEIKYRFLKVSQYSAFMANITKWFGYPIYITSVKNFEEINKEIIPIISKNITATNSQYSRTTDIKPKELQAFK